MANVETANASAIVRTTLYDTFNERVTKSTPLDNTMTDVTIESMLESFEFLTNARFGNSTLTRQQDISGLRSSANDALERNVSNQAFLTFTKQSPLDATKTVSRSYVIPAFKDAMQNPDGSIITPEDPGATPVVAWTAANHLFNLIAILQDNVDYIGADGVHYPGGWTYQPSMSGTGTVTNEIDGI